MRRILRTEYVRIQILRWTRRSCSLGPRRCGTSTWAEMLYTRELLCFAPIRNIAAGAGNQARDLEFNSTPYVKGEGGVKRRLPALKQLNITYIDSDAVVHNTLYFNKAEQIGLHRSTSLFN